MTYADRWTIDLCPRCEGQTHDIGSCGICQNTGILDEDGDPYLPPPGTKGTPAQIVANVKASQSRGARYG